MFKYITKITNVIGDRYYSHRVIKSMFENQNCRYSHTGDECIVLSEDPPGKCFTDEIEIVTSSPYSITLNSGEVKIFTVKVCAEKSDKRGGRKNGSKPVPQVDIQDWISNKFSDLGIDLLSHMVMKRGTDVFHQGNGNKITKCWYEISGHCKVRNSQIAVERLENGIGSAKGFGYGLIHLMSV